MNFETFNVQVDFDESASFDVDMGYTPPQHEYEGSYTVTPSTEEQRLATANTSLVSDIVIEAIPSYYGHISFNGSVITVS